MNALSSETLEFLSHRQPNGKQKGYFDSHAHDWDAINHNDASKLEYIVNLLDIEGHEQILDVGTGTGVMIPYYLNRLSSGNITALDVSEWMILKASQKYPPSERLNYLVSDVCDIRVVDVYDLIVCYSCFPHFPDLRSALAKMSGALHRGGKLVIAHSSSRDHINQVHRNGGEEISKDYLPNITIMQELFSEQGIRTVFSRDDPEYYIAIGVKT